LPFSTQFLIVVVVVRRRQVVVLADLEKDGDSITVAKGGKGGKYADGYLHLAPLLHVINCRVCVCVCVCVV
jgi:hypothetical protein